MVYILSKIIPGINVPIIMPIVLAKDNKPIICYLSSLENQFLTILF